MNNKRGESPFFRFYFIQDPDDWHAVDGTVIMGYYNSVSRTAYEI